MKEPGSSRPATPARKPSRKLNPASRIRARFRRGADRLLGGEIGWSVAFVLVASLLLGSQHCGHEYGQFAVGEVAPEEIVARDEIDVVDTVLTEERRREAREAVLGVYNHDTERGARLAGELAALFDERRRLAAGDSTRPGPAGSSRPVDPAIQSILVARGYDAGLERVMVGAIRDAMAAPVIGNKALLSRAPAIALVKLPGRREERVEDYSGIVDISDARQQLIAALPTSIELSDAEERVLAEFAASFLDANVTLDSETTEQRRESAAAAVAPVLVRLSRGSVLIRKGERFGPTVLQQLDAARRAKRGFGLEQALGLLFLNGMLAFFISRYTRYHQRDFRKLKHLHSLFVLMLLTMMLLTQAILWLAGEVVDSLSPPFNQLDAYTYLIPVGAGAILIALLSNGRIATVYTGFAALLFGAQNGGSFFVAAWAMLVQLSGVYAISTYRERTALLRAGLVVGAAGAITALLLRSLQGGGEPLAEWIWVIGLAFLGGAVGVGLLISFMLPLLEGLFHVLTDIRLLELSNVNTPLLSQLAVKAPGTYNHSLVVGTLAEEAARAIGANSLFCRTAAFYHDIGKINHAEYYVENQRGVNPHDRLSPSMSSLIIASHVKDGIKLAREARLPEQIVEIIPQHHGTRLMTYFYEKARQSTDPSMGPVKEEDFRYPGPKPQTREAAIFMLADGVEAAARTVDDPTPNRLRDVIHKVSSAIVLDRQLDECDMTFSDLEKVRSAFHRLLVSMYHHRVDYPGFDFGKPKTDGTPPAAADSERSAVRRP